MSDQEPREDSRPSRRRFLRALGVGIGIPISAGVYASQIEPFWPEFHEFPMRVANLPEAFQGYRITQLSDLHVSTGVSYPYLQSVIDVVNRTAPDLVVVTGDVVTHGTGLIDDACKLLGRVRARTLVTFGNHDYGRLRGVGGAAIDVASALEDGLRARGRHVLRNRAMPIERDGSRVWFLGMEDLWSGRFAPSAAVASAGRNLGRGLAGEPVIALSHNPDTAPALEAYGVDWVLAGHTHGGQVRLPGYGAIMLPVQNRQWQRGLYQLRQCRMYVSRGVGFLYQARLACRPEVPTFVLTKA